MRRLLSVVSLVVMAVFAAAPARAAVQLFGNFAAWQAALTSAFPNNDTVVTTNHYGAGSYQTVPGFTLAQGPTLSFGGQQEVRDVGIGWASVLWPGSGDVLYTGYLLPTSVTVSVGSPGVLALGFWAQPEGGTGVPITLTVGAQTLVQNADALGDAVFFGWVGTGVTSFTISSTGEFAHGFYVSPVPEPATWAMLLAGFAAVALVATRRRAAAARAA